MQEPEWIDIKKQKPEKEGYYLVAGINPHSKKMCVYSLKYYLYSGRYDRPEKFKFGSRGWLTNKTILFWKPLPEPPKIEEQSCKSI